MCCSLCILCSFRTAPTTTTMWGACGQKRAGTRRACRADVQQRDRAHGAGRRGEPHCLTVQMLASQWVWQKSVIILAEEQNAGRVVDYFYRMEFHITPRFFSDSNYLFFFFFFFSPKKSRIMRCRIIRYMELFPCFCCWPQGHPDGWHRTVGQSEVPALITFFLTGFLVTKR